MEGAFLVCTPPSGRPKGLPYPNQENLWKTCKARTGDREGRPYRAARTYARPGTPGGPVCRPYGNRETSQDTPLP